MATVDEGMGTDEVTPETKEKKTSRSTRRQLLKLAGATLAGAAGGAALKAAPALAYDGQTVTIGSVHGDTIGFATGAYTTAAYGVAIYGGGTTNGIGTEGLAYNGFYAYGAYGRTVGTFGTGVKGRQTGFGPGVWGSSAAGTGVYGNGVTGVWGNGASIGVYAYTASTNAKALYAYTSATGSTAIWAHAYGGLFSSAIVATNNFNGIRANGGIEGIFGYSKAGYGVVGASLTGIDVKLNGSGRLGSVANITGGVYGAPTFTPSTFLFETVRDSYGGMWISRNQGSGQSAWKKVNAVRADSDDGTGTAFKPFRLLDTRSGKYNGVITLADKGPFPKGASLTFTVAGTGSGKQHIPADAAAVFGNLTVTGFTGSGWLTIAPAGAGTNPASDPSSVNFGPGVAPAIANSFFVGLGTGVNAGKITVYVQVASGANVNFIVDITGYSH